MNHYSSGKHTPTHPSCRLLSSILKISHPGKNLFYFINKRRRLQSAALPKGTTVNRCQRGDSDPIQLAPELVFLALWCATYLVSILWFYERWNKKAACVLVEPQLGAGQVTRMFFMRRACLQVAAKGRRYWWGGHTWIFKCQRVGKFANPESANRGHEYTLRGGGRLLKAASGVPANTLPTSFCWFLFIPRETCQRILVNCDHK